MSRAAGSARVVAFPRPSGRRPPSREARTRADRARCDAIARAAETGDSRLLETWFRGADVAARREALYTLRAAAVADNVSFNGQRECRGPKRTFWQRPMGAYQSWAGVVFANVAEVRHLAIAFLRNQCGARGRVTLLGNPLGVQMGRWRADVWGLPPSMQRAWKRDATRDGSRTHDGRVAAAGRPDPKGAA